jgi:hypothetical protein
LVGCGEASCTLYGNRGNDRIRLSSDIGVTAFGGSGDDFFLAIFGDVHKAYSGPGADNFLCGEGQTRCKTLTLMKETLYQRLTAKTFD